MTDITMYHLYKQVRPEDGFQSLQKACRRTL